MKLAIISDIHSNLTALERALKEIERRNVDGIYCLGDIVGYGAQPGPCVDLVREHCTATVMGNHDEAIALNRGVEALPRSGQTAAAHNREKLTDEQIDFLANLPLKLEVGNMTLVHATPQEPGAWVHVDGFHIVRNQFNHFTTDVCFVGHTHIPAIMADKLGTFKVKPGNRYIVNVGSIGQPRDHNTQLAFGIFDDETMSYELVRVPYDVERAVASIQEAGLPKDLWQRLYRGR
ncbi:MAG: metallophosphoesterase family protein [Bacteroidota bacterium]